MDCVILGGGAAGLTAAAALSRRGVPVTLVERLPRVGKKLLATGNGRCNLSNRDMRAEFYGDAAPFVGALYEAVPPARVLGFLSELGLLFAEEEGRLYPRTMQAASVLDALRGACARGGVRVETGVEATRIRPSRHGGFAVETSAGKTLRAGALLAAMGGSAAPQYGTDGAGARLLAELGHTVAPALPALVQLRCEHPALRALAGIRARAALTLTVDGRPEAREAGEVLFAHYGVSGVCVFQLSRMASPALARGRDVRLALDLLPELPPDESWLQARAQAMGGAEAAALLTGALPRLLSQAALDEAGVPRAAACAALTARQIAALWRALRAFPLRVAGTLGLSHAQVTRGGVALREIDPHTMASRLFPGLYVAGELLDADGPCGGYNLHFAFAGALAAADAIASAPGA